MEPRVVGPCIIGFWRARPRLPMLYDHREVHCHFSFLKLSRVGPSEYLAGRPPANTECCGLLPPTSSFLPLFVSLYLSSPSSPYPQLFPSVATVEWTTSEVPIWVGGWCRESRKWGFSGMIAEMIAGFKTRNCESLAQT